MARKRSCSLCQRSDLLETLDFYYWLTFVAWDAVVLMNDYGPYRLCNQVAVGVQAGCILTVTGLHSDCHLVTL